MGSNASIIIDATILVFVSCGILNVLGIISLNVYLHKFSANTSTLLTCSSYLAILLCCLTLLDTYAHILYGNLHPDVSFDNWWCYARIYLLHVGLGSIYHSYLVQAYFRLIRVVFYKFKKLQTFRSMLAVILIQWLTTFLLIMFVLLLHYFVYVPQDHYCDILFTNVSGLLIAASIVCYGPMIGIGSIYFYVLRYMRQTTNLPTQRNRQRANQRDLAVLRRIIILLAALVTFSLPAILLWVVYRITGYLNPLSNHIKWLTFAVSLSTLPIVSALLTPQLRQQVTVALGSNRRVQPIVIVPQCEHIQPTTGRQTSQRVATHF